MFTDKITFAGPYPDADIGDRVACYTTVVSDKNQPYIVRRCGDVIATCGEHSVLVQDEVLPEEYIWVHRTMCFVPGE